MGSIMQFALDMLKNNPRVSNNPQYQEMVDAIKSGDTARGTELARQVCAKSGKTPEEATADARGFFHI